MRRPAIASLRAAMFFAAALSTGCGAPEKRPPGRLEPFVASSDSETVAGGDPAAEQGEREVSSPHGNAVDWGDGAMPVLEGSRYVFKQGELELEVDPELGGRVTRFSLAGTSILTGPEVVASGPDSLPNMFGSTFWTSPQSDWGWPPETEIDSERYEPTLTGRLLTLTGAAGSRTGYRVQKRIALGAVEGLESRGAVTLEYVLQNQSASAPAAPWEISRVPKEGVVLFPARSGPGSASTLQSQLVDGVAWVDIALAPPTDSKLFQDGSEGWLAYVFRDLVFIKTFDNIDAAEQATGEAEVEIFINGGFEYVEIEQQGRYEAIPVGSESTWRVQWLLERRPDGLTPSVGNAALVQWVRQQVAVLRAELSRQGTEPS